MLKFFKQCFISLFVLVITGSAQGASHHPFTGWKTIETSHFSIHFHESTQAVAQKTARYLEEAHTNLSPKYEWTPWGRTEVVLSDQFDDANGFASTLPYNWMFLRIAPPGPETTLAGYDDWLKTLVTHEYTHILHLDAYGGFWTPFRWVFGKIVGPNGVTPPWVKEGTATLEETTYTSGGRGVSSNAEMLVRSAILTDTFPPIDRAAGVHWSWPSGQSQYVYGVKFITFLQEQYGAEKWQAFHRRVERSPFLWAVNHQAKRIYGKSFYKLWEEWRAVLREKYRGVVLEKPEIFLTGKKEESIYLATFSPDGKKMAFVTSGPREKAALWLKEIKTGKRVKIGNQIPTQMTFSPDGKSLVIAALGSYNKYYSYYDLYQINLKTQKTRRLTKGMRARDPEFSPDGKSILFVGGDVGIDHLKIYNVKSKKIRTLVESPDLFTQFAHPRFAPDGKVFAVVKSETNVGWELYLYKSSGKILRRVTHNGLAVESRPYWSRDGKSLYFSSDVGGVGNIYRFSMAGQKLVRVTDVQTGVFQPVLDPNGKLIVRYYNGSGYDLRVLREKNLKTPPVSFSPKSETASKKTKEKVGELPIKTYSLFGKSLFLPRYILPGYLAMDNGLLLTAATGGNDPLHRHLWNGGGSYRSDAKHFGYFGSYAYNRWKPIFGIGILDYAYYYGNLLFTRTGNTRQLYEERRNAYAFVAYPLTWGQSISLSYFYENRSPITALLQQEADDLNLGVYSGIAATYAYGQWERFPASISPIEKGRRFKSTFSISDARLGAAEKNEQRVATADYREFIPLGGNHVLAFRLSGGSTYGDSIFPRTFSIGGSLGEGVLAAGGSSRYFSLRGLPISSFLGDRAMLTSLEYRIPLAAPQRGVGTWPLFLNNLHLGIFADYGDVWNNTADRVTDFFDRFFLGVGGELRADFVIGHGLPVTGRLGYGIIALNRDRLGTLTDPVWGQAARNGVFILQWGTSF